MNSTLFRMYPRGFLGDAANTPVTRKRDSTSDFLQAVRDGNTGPAHYKSLGSPNQAIDILYQDLTLDPGKMERFEWREQLLKAALNAFGTDRLSVWLKAQRSSPYYGRHHHNFVLDCMRFARTGERLQSITSWDMLVTDDDASPLSGVSTSAATAERSLAFETVTELVRRWVGNPGGYSDMAISLYILFGRYEGIY